MNVAEGLRSAGFDIQYPPGLEWIDKVAEGISRKILAVGIEDWRKVLREVSEKLRGKHPLPHLRWALQDGLHRATIKHHVSSAALDAFLSDGDDDIL